MTPDAPPKQIVVHPGIFQRCFWRQCEYAWLKRNRSWSQQVCIHCGATGISQQNVPITPRVHRVDEDDIA
jgi:hypothetical protein